MTTPGQPNPTPAPSAPASGPAPAPSSSPTSSLPAIGTPASSTPATGTPAASAPKTGAAATPPRAPVPPAPTAPKPGGSAAAGAYLLAVVALIIAVVAGGAAAYAIKTAWDIRDSNKAAGPQASATATFEEPSQTTPGSTTSAATQSPTPVVTTPTGPEYLPDFVRAQVNVPLPSSGSCNVAYVDVDTLAVGDAAAAGHEFYLTTCAEPLRIFLDRTSGRAISTVPDPTPEVCHSRVTGTPTSELQLPATQGLTFCLLTSRAQANAQSLPQRLVIVNVATLTSTVAGLVISAYQIA